MSAAVNGEIASGAAGGALYGLAGTVTGPGEAVIEPTAILGGATIGGVSGLAMGLSACKTGGGVGSGNGASTIPGRPYTGKDAAKEAFKHLEKYHGISPEVASERLHNIKAAAGLGAADDVAIGRTGDVYNAANGEWIGSLTAR